MSGGEGTQHTRRQHDVDYERTGEGEPERIANYILLVAFVSLLLIRLILLLGFANVTLKQVILFDAKDFSKTFFTPSVTGARARVRGAFCSPSAGLCSFLFWVFFVPLASLTSVTC